MRRWIMALAGGLLAMSAQAAIRTEVVKYKAGETEFVGYLAYDDAVEGKRPGVLVVPEWWGLNDYAKTRANMLAQLGYVALAVDMYGDGRVAATREQAGELATAVRKDRPLMRARANAALDALRKQPMADPQRLAAMGYCFGGGVALELARSGADVRGVVSFHGNLDTPNPEDAKNIKAKVVVLHGANDPHVPASQVAAFTDEMRKAGVDWQMTFYGGAVHAFTNPASGNDPKAGAAYNAEADKRSWDAMKLFFAEIFAK